MPTRRKAPASTDQPPSNAEPSTRSSLRGEIEMLVQTNKALAEQNRALAASFQGTVQALQSSVDSMVKEVQATLAATQAQLELLRAQTDVTIELQANSQDQTEKLGEATVALIQVSNNLILLMTEPSDSDNPPA